MLLVPLPERPLSPSELAVVESINAHREAIAALSISQIADGAFVSTATVSRTIVEYIVTRPE